MRATRLSIPRLRSGLECEYFTRAIAHIVHALEARQGRRQERELGNDVMQQRAHYGVDAPGLVGILIVVGSASALLAAAGLGWPEPRLVPASVGIGAAIVAALLIFYAAVMLRSSFVSKKRVRDRLVAALALSGSERVLDA